MVWGGGINQPNNRKSLKYPELSNFSIIGFPFYKYHSGREEEHESNRFVPVSFCCVTTTQPLQVTFRNKHLFFTHLQRSAILRWVDLGGYVCLRWADSCVCGFARAVF